MDEEERKCGVRKIITVLVCLVASAACQGQYTSIPNIPIIRSYDVGYGYGEMVVRKFQDGSHTCYVAAGRVGVSMSCVE